MSIALNSFVVVSATVLAVLSVFAAAIAVAGSVLYRSTHLRKEVATRRALGARRSDIARMLLSENVLGIAAGVVIGGLALATTSRTVVLTSATLLILAALIGGWIAGRYAARMPDSKSGRFRTTPDI